jgi:hypothetical protein
VVRSQHGLALIPRWSLADAARLDRIMVPGSASAAEAAAFEGWALGCGIDRAIAGAEQWLRGEITGKSDDEVPAAELLSYIDDQAGYVRALLLPKHILWDRAPDRYGLSDVEWDGQEHGIAIVGIPRTKAKAPLADVRRTNDRIWRSVRGPQRFKNIPGLWFSLDSEPQPFSDIRGLEETLAQHAAVSSERFQSLVIQVVDRSVGCAGWLPIGLNYPARLQHCPRIRITEG